MMFSTSCRGFACWASRRLAHLMRLLSFRLAPRQFPSFALILSSLFTLGSSLAFAQGASLLIDSKLDTKSEPQAEPMNYDADVIVVGAGAAGLAAASELQSLGYKVAVLEARERIGGRVHTLFDGEQAIEMGANWLHGQDDNPLVALAKQQGHRLSALTDWGDSLSYDEYGEEIEDTEDLSDRWYAVVAKYIEQYLEREPNASMQMLMDDAQKSGDLGFVSDDLHNLFINFMYEQDWAADAAELSVQAEMDGEDYRGGDPIPLAGFQTILDPLSEKVDVLLARQVNAVQQLEDSVEISYSYQGQTQVMRAKRLVITVPVSILQAGKIRFSPELSARKLEAIALLGMGHLNKVWLKFPEVFWDDAQAFLRVSPEKDRFSLWLNVHQVSQQPYLLALSTATQLEAGSDAEIVEEAMLALRGMYGDEIPDPLNSYISRWQNDPFSLGAYSYLRQGGRPEHRQILAENEGLIYFAGEASHSEFPSTVHGAYLSGLREAAKIHKNLNPGAEPLPAKNLLELKKQGDLTEPFAEASPKNVDDLETKNNLDQGEKIPALEAKQEQEKSPQAEEFKSTEMRKEDDL